MPDIRTALATALTQNRVREIPKDWDEENSTTKELPVKAHYFQTTTNVTRETFNYVRDNPGQTSAQIRSQMVARNFNASSVYSLLGQMVRQNLIRVDNKLYWPVANEYTPIKGTLLKAARLQELKAAKAALKVVKAAKATPPTEVKAERVVERVVERAVAPTPTPKLLTAAQVLETLSIKEAHVLYRELQTMFG
jgi:hypothetical protein